MTKKFMGMMEQFTNALKDGGNEVALHEGVLSFWKEKKPEVRELDTSLGAKDIELIDSKYPWLIKAVSDILRQEAEYVLKKRRETFEDPTTNIELKLKSIRSSAPKEQYVPDSTLEAIASRLTSAVKYNSESAYNDSVSFARTHVASAFKSIIDRVKKNTPSYMAIDSKALNEADFSGIASSIVCESVDSDSKSRSSWKGHGESYGVPKKRLIARLTANGRKRGVFAESAHPIMRALVKTQCACCGSHIDPDTGFSNNESLNEFKISGYCQECQDSIFE